MYINAKIIHVKGKKNNMIKMVTPPKPTHKVSIMPIRIPAAQNSKHNLFKKSKVEGLTFPCFKGHCENNEDSVTLA